MDGILLINKPSGLTSREVVNIISKKLNIKKIGHCGTLDPMASGVLVICIGKATKLVELLTNHDKIYYVEAILGLLTDTLDITGNIIKQENTNFNHSDIENVISNFPKQYYQEVPIYSAVKIKGKKLYEYARNNEQIELPKKLINIYSIKLNEVKQINNQTNISFDTFVSKGTYIRSLVNDIAKHLNTFGSMSKLIRTKQGEFDINECNSLDDLDKIKLISIEEILKDYYTIEVDDELYIKIKNGALIKNIYNEEQIVFTKDKKVIAIYKIYKDNLLKPFKMFI